MNETWVSNLKMRRITTTLVLTLLSVTGFCQSLETITSKIADRICDCIKDDVSSYSEIKPEFDRCYDQEFYQIFSLVDSTEHKLLTQQGALEKVKNGIIPALNSNCAKIRAVLQAEVETSVADASKGNSTPCPTNFEGKDVRKIKKLKGEIVAFNGLVSKVHAVHGNKPYYQVRLEGGNTLWVASLVNSEYEKEGNVVRLLGYVSEMEEGDTANEYNKTGFHILAFCVIDMDSKQMAMMPGAELQVKEWMSGTVPVGKK
ncbi:hypothetical protein [Catalinimonas alkaloidigena]|nr:hypothetical protein [Catalinimonas alkaloidigena]